MQYQRRILDDTLDELFPHVSAIALEGAKGVGKTATASQRARTVISLGDPGQREALAANLDRVIQVPTPVLVDEWQLEPPVWNRVRRAVDDDPTGGRFLLTGSAGVSAGVRIHSGAGRIGSLHMRPLALSERRLIKPTVSLGALLRGEGPDIAGESPIGVPTYVDEILSSGFPGIRTLPALARCDGSATSFLRTPMSLINERTGRFLRSARLRVTPQCELPIRCGTGPAPRHSGRTP